MKESVSIAIVLHDEEKGDFSSAPPPLRLRKSRRNYVSEWSRISGQGHWKKQIRASDLIAERKEVVSHE
ncbi:hypothetical protein [Enterobacter cloacae]|uniref:hypothetical protein n=1 Tax=Enterobacter cloacae TaxID=550 RepID=UPI0021D3BBC5|nr:hypothetical protein [Enterobacter cloacae]MCU6209275.1 hypothetical protein [Enterobacter cloacae]